MIRCGCKLPYCGDVIVSRKTRNQHHIACTLNESIHANAILHSQAEAGREVVAEVLGLVGARGQQPPPSSPSPQTPLHSPHYSTQSSVPSETDLGREEYLRTRKRFLRTEQRILNAEAVYPALQSTTSFVFRHPPQDLPLQEDPDTTLVPSVANQKALAYERELKVIEKEVCELESVTDHRFQEAFGELQQCLVALASNWELLKRARWLDRQTALVANSHRKRAVVETGQHFIGTTTAEYATHLAAAFIAVTIHLLFNGSRDLCTFVLSSLEMFLEVAHAYPGRPGHIDRTIPPIPKDLDTALSKFDLNPSLQYFAQCPNCGKLHPFEDGSCPPTCNWADADGNVCGAVLMKQVRVQGSLMDRPRKVFVYQSPTQWLGRLLSRPGFEDMMDATARNSSVKEVAEDIWDAKGIHEVPWNDGHTYKSLPKDELRLVLTMAIDWFNAHHSPQGNKSWSVGAIYMVVLNLPPSIRYRPENICLVGIIPGPRKPSYDQMNHFLKPIVEELKPFWTHGKWFSRTPKYEFGRLVWALLLLLVCDLDASRALSGFMGFSSLHFCSCCTLSLEDISNLDKATWTPRHGEDQKRKGTMWKLATSKADQSAIEKNFSARWSDLLSLYYFDPVRHTVIDPAHNILLGNFKHHFRKIFRMDIQVAGGDGSNFIMGDPLSELELEHARGVLLTGKGVDGKPQALDKLLMPSLYALCVEYKLFPHIRGRHTVKNNLLQALYEYRAQNASSSPDNAAGDHTPSQEDVSGPEAPPGSAAERSVNHSRASTPDVQPPAGSELETVSSQLPTSPLEALEARLDTNNRNRWNEAFTKPQLIQLCLPRVVEGEFDLDALSKKGLADILRTKEPTLGHKSEPPRVNEVPLPPSETTPDKLNALEAALRRRKPGNWHKMGRPVIFALCQKLHLDGLAANPLWTWDIFDLVKFLEVSTNVTSRPPTAMLLTVMALKRHLPPPPSNSPAKKRRQTVKGLERSERTVIGADVLEEVRRDLAPTIMPTGRNKAPEALGAAGHGRLSADEWRSTTTIHMVITLGRLWGFHRKDSRYFKMLDNYYHLVIACVTGLARTTSPEARECYTRHMTDYLQGLPALFPQHTFVPNHHLSLHVPDFMEDLGPIHPWWVLPFERLNGLLQRIPTNHKFTMLEKTMMMRYCQSANLRAMIADRSLPEFMKGFYPKLDKFVKGRYRGSLDRDVAALDQNDFTITFPAKGAGLTRSEIQVLKSTLGSAVKAKEAESIFLRGRKYAAGRMDSTLNREEIVDSNVSFRGPDSHGRACNLSGRIQKLVVVGDEKQELYALVRTYKGLLPVDAGRNPYAAWPELPCTVVYNAFDETMHLIPCGDIVAQLVICPFRDVSVSSPCLVVVTLI